MQRVIQTIVRINIGVILESEDAHREAYNAAFQQFDIRCPGADGDIVTWSPEYYDDLQNRVGGGKPKMRHYFGVVTTDSPGCCTTISNLTTQTWWCRT
jgi:hypothetical protein